MRRPIAGTLAMLALLGCAEEPPIDRVGTNAVAKSIFDGAWYMSRVVVDVDYEGAALGTFPGDAASDAAQAFTAMPRIRWVIEEDQLFAFRDYELTAGGDGESPGGRAAAEEIMGQPVAAFAIEKHFDIQRSYNPSTGEELNVIEENDSDRRWYEREYMRVDWSKNLLPGYFGQTYNLNEILGYWKREPADLYVQDASHFPEAWRPRFDTMRCDGAEDTSEECEDSERDLADDYERGELYHMSFVTQEILSPGPVPDPMTGAMVNWCTARYSDAPTCTAHASYVRTSFLKKSERRQYEAVNWVDSRFDRFGLFRLSRDGFDRSTGDPADPAFFYTDFLNYGANRHNLWKAWHDEAGAPLSYAEREVRPIVWTTTSELPAHLIQPSFDVVGQWNETLMQTVRTLRGEPAARYADVDCQREDPDAYCYCMEAPGSGAPLNPRCPGQYDPFTPPDAYAEPAQNPYDCWVEVPEGAEPDLEDSDVAARLANGDFDGWFDARFVGSECASVLRVNTCNERSIRDNGGTTDGLACQERGDLRFKFLSYIDTPGTGFLGIATLRGDPETGEIFSGDANIGGPALDQLRTSAMQTYDLVNGTLSEAEVITGENVRTYFESLGHVQVPARPWSDFSLASSAGRVTSTAARDEIDARMEQAMQRIERLQGPEGAANVFSDRKAALVGSDIERRLASGPEALVAAGLETLPADPSIAEDPTEALLDAVSPFRNDVYAELAETQDALDRISRANVHMPNEYVDASVEHFVERHADWPRARLEIVLNRLLYRQTQLHEMGHCLGLRHDFGSSVDTEHYRPEYYAIAEAFPLPDPGAYDADGEPGLAPDEQAALDRDEAEVRAERERAGIDGAMNSSVMEYTAEWYERLQPLGRYDRAAIMNAYGDLVEAYAGAPAHDTPRESLTGYTGGEACEADSDCPYAADGSRAALLLDANHETGLTQRCVGNPATPSARLCSSFDDDLARRAEGDASLQPLRYRFCTDDRADTTLAWCNRYDEGSNYREIVQNISESYDRMYLFSAFRRYRSRFYIWDYQSSLFRRLNTLQNIYQNLIFRYVSDPAFREEQGSLGFYDQFLATTDILNFYARVLTQPRVGGYLYDPRTESYSIAYTDPADAAADLAVPLGMGRYLYSDYQAGLTGTERIENVGTWYDKVWVLSLLTERGAQPGYTRDVAFHTNFYDLFPNEMQQIFTGIIRGSPEAYMPRLVCGGDAGSARCDDPQLLYMDFYRGDCARAETCRPNPAEVTYAGLPVLDGGSSLSLQIYAAVYGLAYFPVFFDTTFQNQLFICIEGQGDCHEPDAAAVEGVDYVRYTSDQYLRSFLAWQVDPAVGVGEQTSIGFAMVEEARDLSIVVRMLTELAVLFRIGGTDPFDVLASFHADDLAALEAMGYELPTTALEVDLELTRVGNRLAQLESFFNQIIELERDYGIEPFYYYR